LFIARLKRGSI
jgi:hypothetical protein